LYVVPHVTVVDQYLCTRFVHIAQELDQDAFKSELNKQMSAHGFATSTDLKAAEQKKDPVATSDGLKNAMGGAAAVVGVIGVAFVAKMAYNKFASKNGYDSIIDESSEGFVQAAGEKISSVVSSLSGGDETDSTV
jgi:hypothetical protein